MKDPNVEVVANTADLQTESLIRFMAALGYEPVFDSSTRDLVRFYQPLLARFGVATVSLASAIEKHNYGPALALHTIQVHSRPIKRGHITEVQFYNDLIRRDEFLDATTMLFAGQARIVQKVKAQGSKRGLVFTEDAHKVEFNTRYDRKRFGDYINEKVGGSLVRTLKNVG